MKRISLLVALVLGLAVVAALVGTASAKAFTPGTAGWLAPSCSSTGKVLDRISDDIYEEEGSDCSSDTMSSVVCIDGTTLTIWTEGGAELTDMLAAITRNSDTAALGACASVSAAWTPPPPRAAYCSVAGNAWPDGTPIPPGTFLNLGAGQPAADKHYTGAVPAWWVQGVGLTCSLTPAQASLAAASTMRAGAAGDLETPIPGVPDYAFYPYVPAK